MFIAGGGMCLKTAQDIRQSSSRLTHIFVTNVNFDRAKFKQTVNSFGTEKIDKIAVVLYQWILDCDDQKKRICDIRYRIHL